MSKSTDDLKNDFEESKQHLLTLRDELKVKMHLAGMEAKEAWTKLSADIEKMGTKVGHEVSEQTKATVKDLLERAKKLRDSLKST